MKKMIVVAGVLVALAASSYALNAYAGEGMEDEQCSLQVKALMEEGMDKEEAKILVDQAIKAAKEEGLEGEALSAKVEQTLQAAKEAKAQVQEDVKEAEHPSEGEEAEEVKAAEHPVKADAKTDAMQAKPLDHPAH